MMLCRERSSFDSMHTLAVRMVLFSLYMLHLIDPGSIVPALEPNNLSKSKMPLHIISERLSAIKSVVATSLVIYYFMLLSSTLRPHHPSQIQPISICAIVESSQHRIDSCCPSVIISRFSCICTCLQLQCQEHLVRPESLVGLHFLD